MVAANLDDIESLKRAFEGAYGAFCLTNYWEHSSPEKETAQAKTQAQAAKHARLQHVIWSAFEDTRRWVPLSDNRMPTLMGKYQVPHFDAKAEADAGFAALAVPTTLYLTSFYWENLINLGMGPRKDEDGKLAITLSMADKKLPGVAVDDLGKCALGIFKRGNEFIGRTVGGADEHLTGAQMAAAVTRAFGQEVRYNAVEPADYAKLGFPGADDLANIFQFKRDFQSSYLGAPSLSVSRTHNPDLQTFDMWLAHNKHRIPLE